MALMPSPGVRRWSLALLAALLLGALLGSAAGPLLDARLAPRGAVYGPPPAVDHAEHVLGINADLSQLDAASRQLFYTQAAQLGARWVRLPVPWREGPGITPDWSRLDALVDEAAAHQLRVLALLDEVPPWTRDASHAAAGAPPADWRVFGPFAFQLATHFKGRIAAYQVWDEPNLSAGWFDRNPDPAAYTRLLREAALQIRSADPGALIVSAALAPTTESGPLNINEPDFLREMYRAGARDSFDALGAEPFGFWTGPDDRRADIAVLNFARLSLLREVMQTAGDGAKSVWATAFGWNVGGAPDSPYGSDTAAQQTARTLDALRRARDEWPWLGPMLFARWRPEGAADARAGFALAQPDGSPGPLLAALLARGTAPIDTVGRYRPDDPAAQYPPAWRVTPGGADLPQNDPAPALIHFRGTRFDLSVRRGQYDGILFVSVDGAPANALPRDEQGRSYVVLFDPLGLPADVTLARGLPDGEHVVSLVAAGGWGQWAIAGWAVAREPAPAAPWPLAGAGVALLLLLLATAVLRLFPLLGNTAFLRPLPVLGNPPVVTARENTPVPDLVSPGSVGALPSLPPHAIHRLSPRSLRPGEGAVGQAAATLNRLAIAAAPNAQWLIFGAGVLLYLSPNAALSWLLIVILTLLILWHPHEGLALVALSIPYYLQPKPLGIGSYAVVEIVLLLCALSVVGRLAYGWWQALAQGRRPALCFSTGGLDGVVWLWLVSGALGVLVAENFGVANREFRVVFLEPALYYLLIRLTKVDAWLLVNAFLAGATLVSLQGIADWLRHTNVITTEGVPQARSVYFSANNLALYLDRAVPLAAVLFLFGWPRASASHSAPGSAPRASASHSAPGPAPRVRPAALRLAYGLACIITLLAIYLTFVKGAWLLALPAALLLVGALRGRKVFAPALLVLALLAASLVPVLGTTRIRSLFDLTAGTTFIRVQLWQSAVNMLRDHPLFGVGLDNFLYQYRTRYILPTAFVETGLSHPHNILLDFWTRLGLLGVLLLVLLLVVFWRRAYACYRSAPDPRARALALGLMASLLAALAHGLIDNSFFLVDLAFVLMLTLAIVQQAALQTGTERVADAPARPAASS